MRKFFSGHFSGEKKAKKAVLRKFMTEGREEEEEGMRRGRGRNENRGANLSMKHTQ